MVFGYQKSVLSTVNLEASNSKTFTFTLQKRQARMKGKNLQQDFCYKKCFQGWGTLYLGSPGVDVLT